jgi:tetratricopeptide (TPR) repeat protein
MIRAWKSWPNPARVDDSGNSDMRLLVPVHRALRRVLTSLTTERGSLAQPAPRTVGGDDRVRPDLGRPGDARALCTDGEVAVALGEYARATEILRAALAGLERGVTGPDAGAVARTTVLASRWLASALAETGQFREAALCAADALRHADAARDALLVGHAYAATAFVSVRTGDVEAACGSFERLRETARAGDSPSMAALADAGLLHAYAIGGRAEAHAMIARTAVGPGHALFDDPVGLAWIAEAHLALGRHDEAAALAARALEVTRARGQRGHEAWALRALAEVAARRGGAGEAEARYLEALGLAATLGMRPLAVRCHLGLAAVHGSAGNGRAADEHQRAATLLAGELGMSV